MESFAGASFTAVILKIYQKLVEVYQKNITGFLNTSQGQSSFFNLKSRIQFDSQIESPPHLRIQLPAMTLFALVHKSLL